MTITTIKPKTYPIKPLAKMFNIIQCPACALSSYPKRSRSVSGATIGINRCLSGHLFAVREENGFAQCPGDVIHLGQLFAENKRKYGKTNAK